jgi:hypothetical protein
MLNVIIIAVAVLLTGYLAFSKRLASSSSWKATVTPLASIMGSGFLVSAPLLAGVVGNLAVVCMAVLLVLAYAVGSAIRFNIRHFEPIENEGHGPAQDVAFVSRVVLAAAYFISVTYYLQLLAAFVLNAVGVQGDATANAITTLLLLVIGCVGIWRGLEFKPASRHLAIGVPRPLRAFPRQEAARLAPNRRPSLDPRPASPPGLPETVPAAAALTGVAPPVGTSESRMGPVPGA